MSDTHNKSNDAEVSPVRAGLLCRCPHCGKGKLYRGYLKVAEQCSKCTADFGSEDAGDGPAVFVMLIVGFLIAFSALYVEVNYMPPYWLHAALWLPLTVILTLGLLPPFKGLLVALQFHHKAEEARLAEDVSKENE